MVKVLDRLKRIFTRRKSAPDDPTFWMTQRALRGAYGDSLTDAYAQNPWVRSGVERKSEIVASTPFDVVMGTRRDEEGEPLPSDAPLYALFAQPNPWCDGGEMFGQWTAYRDLEGEAFACMFGVKAEAGGYAWWAPDSGVAPTEILTLDPRSVSVADEDRASGMIRGWRVSTAAGQVIVPAYAMIHVKRFNPRDLRRGSSPLGAAATSLDSDVKADSYQRALLANGGAPDGTLTVPGSINGDEAKALRDAWEDRHSGASKAGRVAVLHSGTTYAAIAQTAKDMQMPALRAWSKTAVKAVLGVTDFEVGDIADYSRANSQTAKAWLWETTIIPALRAIERALWARLFQPLSARIGRDVWLRFDLSKIEALKPNLTETAGQAAALVGAGYDAASVAEMLGLDVEVGDGLGAIEVTDGGGEAQASAGAVQDAAPVAVKSARRPKRSRVALEKVMARSERALAARVRGAFRKLAADVSVGGAKDAARRRYSQADIEKMLGDKRKWAAVMRGELGDVFRRVLRAHLSVLDAETGGFQVVRLDDPKWTRAADARVAEMAKVSERTRTRLAASIVRALTNPDGVTVDELAKEIDRKFGRVIASNGATIARTESAMYGNSVRAAAMADEGIDSHEWSASMDVHTRDAHVAVDGETRKIGEPFSNGLKYPGEPGGPADEVINCRCVALAKVTV